MAAAPAFAGKPEGGAGNGWGEADDYVFLSDEAARAKLREVSEFDGEMQGLRLLFEERKS